MMPNSKIMIEIKYRESPKIKETEAIVEWSKKEQQTAASLLITKNGGDYGLLEHAPIMRIPAFAFLYLLGHAEKHGLGSLFRVTNDYTTYMFPLKINEATNCFVYFV